MDLVAALSLSDDFTAIRTLFEEDAGFYAPVEWIELGK